MATLDEQGRPHPPSAADEQATLPGFLDFQRATFAWKCAGLDGRGLSAAFLPPTFMTLGGIMKHLAIVEDYWFSHCLHAEELSEPWGSVDWISDPDWEWRTAADESPDELWALWNRCVERSRSLVAETLGSGDLGTLAGRPGDDGETPSLRWIVVHMIEEYARHNGHADLLRESIDGATGE